MVEDIPSGPLLDLDDIDIVVEDSTFLFLNIDSAPLKPPCFYFHSVLSRVQPPLAFASADNDVDTQGSCVDITKPTCSCCC